MKKRLILITIFFALIAIGVTIALKSAYVFPVLMYHSINYRDKVTKLSVSPESFARQMEFLHKHKYNVVPLEDVIYYIQKNKKVPPKTLAITFDDGFYNNYKYAYPILKKYNIPATIFVITGNIGKAGFLNWAQIKEMSDSGIISIESHTVNHLWLPDVSPEVLQSEIEDSKRVLEEKLGKTVKVLCYPVGAFDDKVKRAVKKSGYSCAVTTSPGRSKNSGDIYAIKRIKISRTSDNLFVFWVEAGGIYTWIKETRDD